MAVCDHFLSTTSTFWWGDRQETCTSKPIIHITSSLKTSPGARRQGTFPSQVPSANFRQVSIVTTIQLIVATPMIRVIQRQWDSSLPALVSLEKTVGQKFFREVTTGLGRKETPTVFPWPTLTWNLEAPFSSLVRFITAGEETPPLTRQGGFTLSSCAVGPLEPRYLPPFVLTNSCRKINSCLTRSRMSRSGRLKFKICWDTSAALLSVVASICRSLTRSSSAVM